MTLFFELLKVYPGPLEKVEEFGGLCDFVDTFSLVRGKKKKRPDDDDEEVGEFKVCKAYVIMSMIRQNCSPSSPI